MEFSNNRGATSNGRIISNMAIKAGLVASLATLPNAVSAQVQNSTNSNTTNVASNDGDNSTLETVTISGNTSISNINAAQSGSSRLPGTIRDIPQVVNVVPEHVMIEQNVMTLEQALQNVPGITTTIGEGGGGMNGDRFRIRGFDATGDTYSDGLRDIGVYVRDSFNMEQVQVFKGPNGENFGVGTTGGAVNSTSKRARLGTFGAVNFSTGNGPLYRPTIDYNQQINDTTAVRFNVMGNWQDVVDRNHVTSNRWGLATSAGFGLGTNQTWHLGYFYQKTDRLPDYGIPFVADPNGISRPVTEYGVPRNIFYGKNSDRDKSEIHMVTSNYRNEINEWLTFTNDTRYTHFKRYFSATPIRCAVAAQCTNALFGGGGNPLMAYGGGGGVTYDQKSWGLQNISTAVAKFETGAFRHQAVLGLDMMYQDDQRQGYRYTSPKSLGAPRLWTENMDSSYYSLVPNPDNYKDSNSRSVALFLSDRMWLNDQFSIMAGLRWDYQKINYDVTTAAGINSLMAKADYISPKASVIWEPTKAQTYYFSWSVSNNLPFGQYITSDFNPVTAARIDWDPEKSELFELGGKIDLLDGRIGLTGALFQVEKNNALYNNPDGSVTRSGEKQRVRGFEAGLTGKITEQWDVYTSYTYLQSKILDSATSSVIGNSVPGAAKNAASLWTTYDLAPHFNSLNGKLLIGGGMTYRDAVPVSSNGLSRIPHSFTLDAMASYETEKWRFSANAYNLTDRTNYTSYMGGSRAIPTSGRSFVINIGAKF